MKIFLVERVRLDASPTESPQIISAFDLSETEKLERLKESIAKASKISPIRQRITFARGPKIGKPLLGATLKECGLGENEEVYVAVKDLGPQISWKLVFLIEYFGPLWLFPVFFLCPQVIYGADGPAVRPLAQKLALSLVLFHYCKRELETLLVHRFSNVTMPISRLPINCTHYWVLFGVAVGYYTMHPKYQPPPVRDATLYSLAGLMMVCEVMNAITHIILRNLRKPGSKARGIPRGAGFDQVSCANYYWETLSWIFFCMIVRSFTAWTFLAVAFLQMAEWAHKKHKRYLVEFPDYPRNRTAILPFIA